MGNAVCFHVNSPKSASKHHHKKADILSTPKASESPPLENLSFFAQKYGDDNYFGVIEIQYYSKNIENRMKDARTVIQEKNISFDLFSFFAKK